LSHSDDSHRTINYGRSASQSSLDQRTHTCDALLQLPTETSCL